MVSWIESHRRRMGHFTWFVSRLGVADAKDRVPELAVCDSNKLEL